MYSFLACNSYHVKGGQSTLASMQCWGSYAPHCAYNFQLYNFCHASKGSANHSHVNKSSPDLKFSSCPSLVSVTVIKTVPKSNLERKGFISAHS